MTAARHFACAGSAERSRRSQPVYSNGRTSLGWPRGRETAITWDPDSQLTRPLSVAGSGPLFGRALHWFPDYGTLKSALARLSPARPSAGVPDYRPAALHPHARAILAHWYHTAPPFSDTFYVFRSRKGHNRPLTRQSAWQILMDAYTACGRRVTGDAWPA